MVSVLNVIFFGANAARNSCEGALCSFATGITANVWLFAVAGIGGFKNGAQRNVKADLL